MLSFPGASVAGTRIYQPISRKVTSTSLYSFTCTRSVKNISEPSGIYWLCNTEFNPYGLPFHLQKALLCWVSVLQPTAVIFLTLCVGDWDKRANKEKDKWMIQGGVIMKGLHLRKSGGWFYFKVCYFLMTSWNVLPVAGNRNPDFMSQAKCLIRQGYQAHPAALITLWTVQHKVFLQSLAVEDQNCWHRERNYWNAT